MESLAMWSKTSATELLQISYPIIQAPMAGGVTTPELVAAVSQNGGLGSLGAGYLKPEQIRHAIRNIRERTDQPFAVNLFVPEEVTKSEKSLEKMNKYLFPIRSKLGSSTDLLLEPSAFKEQIEVLIDEKIPIFSFTFGIPEEKILQRLRASGIITIGTATTVEEAICLEQSGVHMVIAQGSEAGGHRGTFIGNEKDSLIGSIVLIPTIAAGGIMDARGILASLILGASAVQMGTAFIPTQESGAHPLYKETLLNSIETDTVITKKITGKAVRALKNELIQTLEEYDEIIPAYPLQHMLTQGIRQAAAKQANPAWMSMWSGQGTRLCKEQTVQSMMKALINEIDQLKPLFL